MSEFVTDSGTIYYEILESDSGTSGARGMVTLLHNFMSTGRTAWGPLLKDLMPDYRVLLPDLPGHGRSQGYPDQFDHRVMAQQIAALMQAEGAEQGHLAGCSAGGMLAQLLVYHRFVQPATVTLVSTTHSVDPATTGEPTSLDPQDFRASVKWLEATARLHDPYQGNGYFDRVLLPAFRNLTPENVIDLPLTVLHNWQFPVCIIHGSDDEIFPVGIAKHMAAALPNAELHIIPEQTHALIFRRPWKVSEYMTRFLGRHITQST